MKMREMLTHNIGLKALSLFLASVLWLFVAAGQKSEIGLTLPVKVTNLPPGLAIANRLPARIDVRLAGPRIMLLRLNTDRHPVLLDLKGAGEGTTSFPELETKLSIPYGIRVTRMTPASIEVKLARAGSTGK
jgi:YbbR domain-containing protein